MRRGVPFNNIFMFTENKSTSALLCFYYKTFKCIILFRNIELLSLAQSVERSTRYFYIIRQYITLYYQLMSLKQFIYLSILLSFTLNLKMKNKYVSLVWLELGTSRSRGEHLNHYTTESRAIRVLKTQSLNVDL